MSLFKVCTSWSAQCPDLDENYDSFSLLCTRFGLDSNEKDYIVVGSHTGHLSIFYLNAGSDNGSVNGNCLNGYKPTDLLLECKLNSPILELSSGRFTGTLKNENTNHLAVLHPKSLAIYGLSTIEGVAQHGSQSTLNLIVEHKFLRSAFHFTKGHFGQVKGREFFCVTHMDGTLTFFEQDGILYECQLPGPKALPSLMTYITRTDSFIRINSAWELESFSYQEVSHSAINKSETSASWTVCIGEYILDISPVQIKENFTSIMILGEHNLFNINDNGKVEFIVKLDYSPKCFHSFIIGYYWEANSRLITALVSECSSLLIYDGPNLIWAAQLDEIPVAIKRSNLNSLPGAIVTLSANGLVHVGYLGAEPSVFQVPPLNLQEMHFEKAHQELVALEEEIKQGIDLGDVEMINQSAANDIGLEFEILSKLELCTHEILDANLKEKSIQMCNGILKFHTKLFVHQMQICFNTTEGIKCTNPLWSFNDVPENSKQSIEVSFYLNESLNIPSLEIQVVVSYITKQNIPRVLTVKRNLPLNFLYKPTMAQKDSKIKLTFTINSNKSNATKFSEMFPEFCTTENETQALGLSLISNDDTVTIITAKNSNRIRIQAENIETIPPVLERIQNYINSQHPGETLSTSQMRKSKRISTKIQKGLIAAPSLPSNEILQCIDSHHNIQIEIRKQTALMDALWSQFKLFQRSLQLKMENEPTDGIMMLIEKNYDDLILEGDKLMEMRIMERSKKCNLSCSIALATQIIKCLSIEERITKLVLAAFVSPAEDWTELSWEESMAPGIDMLNYYGPLSRGKITSSATKSVTAAGQFDYVRFRKHIVTLFERLCRLASTDPKRQTEHLNANEFNVDNGETKSVRRLSKQSRLEALEDEDEEDDDDEIRAKSENDWVSSDIPPPGLLMLRSKTTL